MPDLSSIKERLAKCIRLFGSAERANARIMTERALASIGASWTDLGDYIATSFSEVQMDEIVEAIRKQERARMPPPPPNGHFMLPDAFEMAEYCHGRLGRLKDDKQRNFVSDMYLMTQHGAKLSRPRLGYLASLYIQAGGKI